MFKLIKANTNQGHSEISFDSWVAKINESDNTKW